MTSAEEKICHKSRVGSFEKTQQTPPVQASCSSSPIHNPDCTTEHTAVFTPLKKPKQAASSSDLVGGFLYEPIPAISSAEDTIHSKCTVTECLEVNGPSTPMQFFPRPKYAPVAILGTGDSSSLPLTTGFSCPVWREVEQKQNCIQPNRKCTSKGFIYYQQHSPKNSTSSKISDGRIRSEAKSGGLEINKENMLSLSWAKPENVKPSLGKSDFDYVDKTFCISARTMMPMSEGARTKMPMSEGIDMQHHMFNEKVSSQIRRSLASHTSNLADNRQPSRSIPGTPHFKTGYNVLCPDTFQETKASGALQAPPCGRGSLSTHTFKIVECDGSLQGVAPKSQYNTFELGVSTQTSTNNNMPIQNLNYKSVLQTAVNGNGDGHQLVSNLYAQDDNCSISGKKRKSTSILKQAADLSGDMTGKKNCLKKSSEKLQVDKNYCQEERASQTRQEGKHIYSRYHDFVNSDSMNKHIKFNGRYETQFLVSEEVDKFMVPGARSNTMGKLRELPESVALELHCNGTINSSGNKSSQSLAMPDAHGHSELKLGNISVTSSLEGATEALTYQRIKENTMAVRSLNGQHQSSELTFSAAPSMPTGLSTFSFEGPSFPQTNDATVKLDNTCTHENKTIQRDSTTETDWGKFLALSTAQVNQSNTLPYQQRFIKLQAFLKQCDEPNQEYLQTICSLSASGRSEYAVELETRAIILSLEEGKELHRMKLFNVFGKDLQRTESENDANATPQGPRLPAPKMGTEGGH